MLQSYILPANRVQLFFGNNTTPYIHPRPDFDWPKQFRLQSVAFKFVKITISAPTPPFVTQSAVLFNLELKAVAPFARHLCCHVEHKNALQFQNFKQ